MKASHANVELIRRVSDALGPLRTEVAFVGGATVGLLLTDETVGSPRPTDDVDVIVEVASTMDYQTRLRDELRRLGFREDTSQGAPLCRWIVDGIKVDVMPTDPNVLGLRTRWFATALREAHFVSIPAGQQIRLITAPCFIATKIEAFDDRGERDYAASADVEDVVTVVDGREEIVEEVAASPSDLRDYVQESVRRWLETDAFRDAIPGHLGYGRGGRVPSVLDRFRKLGQ
jgi:predicted nucleotidyltransferase